ncbi:MAG: crotonase/enoyl-CoA hydratase family protein, partial [Mariprofundaceae bacterium]|nr:crotonase/enoyl-CoA hydratase family protein [Mariprofundaceae bacterium]
TVRPLIQGKENPYTQLDVQHDEEYGLVWFMMHASPRPSFTPALLGDLLAAINDLPSAGEMNVPRYLVLASDVDQVFNLGGDLDRFADLIRAKNRPALLHYAKACIDALYSNRSGHGRGITTISLVQGDALGGGFEAAISSDVLIAERSAKMGFPEILFNLFPGMGAYSFLSRKVGHSIAEKMILSGRLYSAEELFDLGVVDVLAEDGHGEKAVYDYISQEDKSRNGITAFRAARKRTNPLAYDELQDVIEIWVDAALRLRDRDLRMMERLVKRQSARNA